MLYTEQAVVRHLESWCRDHLGKHDSPEYAAYHAAFARHLATKRDEQLTAHSNRGLFGMSQAGGCIRAQGFRRDGIEGEPPHGDERMTWEVGHLLECATLAILEVSGFQLQSVQEPISWGPFASAVDGVLADGPVPLPYPVVVSVKTASYKSSSPPRGKMPAKRYGFAGLPLDGIYKSKPEWFVQAQLEMAATGLKHTLVVVIAKDMIAAFREDAIFRESGSLTWYAELVTADLSVSEATAQWYELATGDTDRQVGESAPPLALRAPGEYVRLPAPGDTASGWGGPNKEATGRFNPCFSCAYATRCWGMGHGE